MSSETEEVDARAKTKKLAASLDAAWTKEKETATGQTDWDGFFASWVIQRLVELEISLKGEMAWFIPKMADLQVMKIKLQSELAELRAAVAEVEKHVPRH